MIRCVSCNDRPGSDPSCGTHGSGSGWCPPETCLIRDDGKIIPLKNLGWLLHNWTRVERFQVEEPGTARTPNNRHLPLDARLIAHLHGGGQYQTVFASKKGLKVWLERPVFRGLEVDWFGYDFVL